MCAKKWIKTVFLLLVLNVVSIGGINYMVDPFNIFHTDILKHQFQINERFMKIEYLEENNQKFNGYIFGSSRVGTTSPEVVEQYIPNSKFYNFTISSANLYDYLIHLEYFIKQGYPIDILYMQLDIDNISSYGRVPSDYLRKLHPYVLEKSLIPYYFSYLSGFFPFNIKGKISKNIDYNDRTDYFLDKGMWTKPDKEIKIRQDCTKYVESVADFHINHDRVINYTTAIKTIEALKKIKDICDKNSIKLYIFTTPHNKSMMDLFVMEDYFSYLKDISEITDFYDFSGYNTVTTNHCNYYETSHYRPLVGSLIAGRIFNDKLMKVPDDFGIFVTKESITQHLENLKKQIIN